MSNTALVAVTVAFLAGHVIAVIAALVWRPSGAAAIPAVNAAVAVILLGYNVPRLLAYPGDGARLGLVVFETLVLLLAAAAFWRVRLAFGAAWAIFALHAMASLAAVVFALTFRITRLF